MEEENELKRSLKEAKEKGETFEDIYYNIWSKLSEEEKDKNYEEILDLALELNVSFFDICSYIFNDLSEGKKGEKYKDFIKIGKEKGEEFSSIYFNIWDNLSQEVKDKDYQEIIAVALELNTSFFDICYCIFYNLSEEEKGEKYKDFIKIGEEKGEEFSSIYFNIWDKLSEKEKDKNYQEFINILSKNNFEYSEICSYIFNDLSEEKKGEKYKDFIRIGKEKGETFSNIYNKVWNNLSQEVKDKDYQEILDLALKLNISFEDICYYIFNNLSDEVKGEKYKDFIEIGKEKGETFSSIYNNVLSKVSQEVKDKDYQEIMVVASELNTSFFDICYCIFNNLSEKKKGEKYKDFIKIGKEKGEEFLNIYNLVWNNLSQEVKDKDYQEILDLALEFNISFDNICSYIFYKLSDEVKGEKYRNFIEIGKEKGEKFSSIYTSIFSKLTQEEKDKSYKYFINLALDFNASFKEINSIFEDLGQEFKENNYEEILEYAKSCSPDLYNYAKSHGYINMIINMEDDKKNKYIEENHIKILNSLRCLSSKYDDKEEISDYSKENVENLLLLYENNVLDKYNIDFMIQKVPDFGEDFFGEVVKIYNENDCKDIIREKVVDIMSLEKSEAIKKIKYLGLFVNRIYNSNSNMIRNSKEEIFNLVINLNKSDAMEILELFENEMIPDFVKIFKFYETVVEKRHGVLKSALKGSSLYSPELQQAGTEMNGKKIIFSDLFNIALKSNNKSLKNFFDILENGNKMYVDYLNGSEMTEDDNEILKKYSNALYLMYRESGAYRYDEKNNRVKVEKNDNYIKLLEDLSRRYIGGSFPNNLSNEILNTIIGRYDELLAGRRTIEDFKKYMDNVNNESNMRHIELEKERLVLEPGDLIKGIRDANLFLQSLFSNGIRAGEFLGVNEHSDCTPLDSDHSLILPSRIGDTLSQTISKTTSSSYGDFIVVIKNNPQKLEFTRGNGNDEYESKLGIKANKDEILERVSNRINNTFEEPKLETFLSSTTVNSDHYGVRTGMSITDVDYIVVSRYDKRIGYELAMNGTFIPVVDRNNNKIIFGIEDYNKIRDKMRGLPYYTDEPFVVDSKAYNSRTIEKADEIFANGKSSVEEESSKKRKVIEEKVEGSMQDVGLGLKTKVTGNMEPGFVEFIDTGSTGRGTNIPGAGDFDFMLKLDRKIMESPNKLGKVKNYLRRVLAIKFYNDSRSSLQELNGNFRYKNIKIDGLDMPIDLDVTFVPKTEGVVYSTDMSVRERLNGIRANNEEEYKIVVANIILAKEMLKKEGIYKKISSEGATEYGGFGGVGVENWILQNGGSFVKAMETFLEASEKSKSLEEFMEIYPIFDFGENHIEQRYSHDSFVRGITRKNNYNKYDEKGYLKMKEKFEELVKSFSEFNIQELAENAARGTLSSDFDEAHKILEERELSSKAIGG